MFALEILALLIGGVAALSVADHYWQRALRRRDALRAARSHTRDFDNWESEFVS